MDKIPSSKKGSFVLYADQKEIIEDLSFEEKGRLLDALFDYSASGEVPSFDDKSLLVSFKMFKVRIDRDNGKYMEICAKRKESITKRWNIQKNTNVYKSIQADTNDTDKDKDKDKDKGSRVSKDTMGENKKDNIIPPFIPPQGEERKKLLAKIEELEEKHATIVQEMSSRQEELERENAELKDKIEKDKKANRDLDLSIVSEEMMPVVEEWLAYKRQKRQSYKPKGFVIFYNKLMKDCGGSVTVARQMVDFSIANNYDGLFRPKESYMRHELPGQVMRGEKREYNEDNFFGR